MFGSNTSNDTSNTTNQTTTTDSNTQNTTTDNSGLGTDNTYNDTNNGWDTGDTISNNNTNTNTQTDTQQDNTSVGSTPDTQDDQTQTDTNDEYNKAWDDDGSIEDNISSFNNINDTNSLDNNQNYNDSNEDYTLPNDKEKQDLGVIIDQPLKYKGREIPITSKDEAVNLMQKGLDYEFKMNRIKPFRQAIDIIEKNNLTPEDLDLITRIKAGDQDAIQKVLDISNNDVYSEENNIKEQYNDTNDKNGTLDGNTDIDKYWIQLVQSKPDVAGKAIKEFQEIDPTFRNEIISNKVLNLFVGSVESGEFDKVYPNAVKIKALNPSVNWLTAYAEAAKVGNVEIPTQKEPTRTQRVKQTNVRTVTSSKDEYDKVWDDNSSLDEFEKYLF